MASHDIFQDFLLVPGDGFLGLSTCSSAGAPRSDRTSFRFGRKIAMQLSLEYLLLLNLWHLSFLMNRSFIDLTKRKFTILWINFLEIWAQFSGLLFEWCETLGRFIKLFLVFWRFFNFYFVSPFHMVFKLRFTNESPSTILIRTDEAVFFRFTNQVFGFICALLS